MSLTPQIIIIIGGKYFEIHEMTDQSEETSIVTTFSKSTSYTPVIWITLTTDSTKNHAWQNGQELNGMELIFSWFGGVTEYKD